MFLTAKLKLRPSRRKAVVLERARAAAEHAFWDRLADLRDVCATLHEKEKKDRKAEISKLTTDQTLEKYQLHFTVRHGLARDLKAAVSSFVELKAGGHPAEWPSPAAPHADRYDAGLDALVASMSKEEEDAARDEIYRGGQAVKYRPFTFHTLV